MKQKISIIIPSHNEEQYINQSLKSIFSQEIKPFEIIVINDASSDKTKEIVKSLINKHKNLKLINRSKCKGYTYAILSGIKAAKGDIIAIFDADSKAPKSWIKKVAKAFHNKDVACVGGPYLPHNTHKLIPKLEMLYIQYLLDKNKNRGLAGTNLAFDMKKAKKIGLFLNPPEYSIDKHIQEKFKENKFRCVYLKDNPVLSRSPETITSFFKQWLRWGKGMSARKDKQLKKFIVSSFLILSLPAIIASLMLEWKTIFIYTIFGMAITTYIYLGFKKRPNLILISIMILQKYIGLIARSIGYFKFKIIR